MKLTVNVSADGLYLASAYVPYQNNDFDHLYEPDEALESGTVFPELHLPQIGMECLYEK